MTVFDILISRGFAVRRPLAFPRGIEGARLAEVEAEIDRLWKGGDSDDGDLTRIRKSLRDYLSCPLDIEGAS